ncbi:hypothetical protein SAMN05192555_10578 [Franzmannia pantelleriensis]|uniref:Uncharacterized protein n=1 Tax=Franzmannia pantelleriensis TaxID=48727 RepID=A0A1G9KX80_9GAMM|nr:hypothetical protein [Halomonas pantelleriensis]SDL54067.1 hypothetical protein SAMN05192555_10578 [Halomonas pantelleriensis]
MRMKSLLVTTVAVASLPLAATAQAACQDDERLYRMGDFLEAQSDGNAEPLQLTAETYLRLTPNARDVIGDNLRLLDANCNTMQVVGGEPPVKVEIPFPLLYNAFEDAVLRGDEKTSGILLRSFRAEPMDSAGFLGLFTLVSEDQELIERLASAGEIAAHTSANAGSNAASRCNEPTVYLHYADFFVRFSGQVEGYNNKAWYVSGNHREITSVEDNLTHSLQDLPGMNCRVGKEAVLTVASAAGAIAIDIGNIHSSNWNTPSTRRTVVTAHEQWLEAGAPDDDGPQSLFD